MDEKLFEEIRVAVEKCLQKGGLALFLQTSLFAGNVKNTSSTKKAA